MPQKSIRQALNEALRQEMRRDPTIIVIGEEGLYLCFRLDQHFVAEG